MKNKREYWGEEEAATVVKWLNANNKDKEQAHFVEKITNILSGFQALESWRARRGGGKMMPPPERDPEDALAAISTALNGFVLRPTVSLGPGDYLVVGLRFRDERDRLPEVLHGNVFEIVLLIYELAQMGVVGRISQCRMCRQWFYKKTKQHECCSRDCSVAYSKTPAMKQERNRKLREQRAIAKKREQESLMGGKSYRPHARGKRRSTAKPRSM